MGENTCSRIVSGRRLLILLIAVYSMTYAHAQQLVLEGTMRHLRNGGSREWSEFALQADQELELHFSSQQNNLEQTIELRQYDVRQLWHVLVNNKEIGTLVLDEKDITTYFKVPPHTLQNGDNVLRVRSDEKVPDDIRVGEMTLYSHTTDELLSARVDVTVLNEKNFPMPSRITILNSKGSLQTIKVDLPEQNAVRPGYVYTLNKACIHLPPGTYTIYAGRGFEYGIDSVRVTIKHQEHLKYGMMLKREVDTQGWVSSDTHIHTFTHSRHGDATIEERALTIAGEGIELPVMTDHNIYVDIGPVVDSLSVRTRSPDFRKAFTAVVGDEVTTQVGHFNVFKTTIGKQVIDHTGKDWGQIAKSINSTGDKKTVILNHARDIHNDFRPFDPSRHLSSAGMSKGDWQFPANAMEVVNSGSQQTDIMLLFQDWLGMLNGGHLLTPVGSSDSHDVSRFTVGQGRTYIESNDKDTGHIDVEKAIANFLEGRVMVSCGLLTKMRVNGTYGPGDIVRSGDQVNVTIEVSGPKWTSADKVSLYANGKKIREEKIVSKANTVVKWQGSWKIDVPAHDVFLVAIAEGPGDGMPYWPIAKPFQPMSIDWQPRLIGATGAVWIDGDKNGKRNSARDYAVKLITDSGNNMDKLITLLNAYDEAVAVQVVALLWKNGKDITSLEISTAFDHGKAHVKAGYKTVLAEVAMVK